MAILGIFYLNNQQYIVKISFFKKTILLNNKLIIVLAVKKLGSIKKEILWVDRQNYTIRI